MDLKNFKLMSEAHDSYHIASPTGKMFTVDKKSLKPEAHEMIKKMCSGGTVQNFDDGGIPVGTNTVLADDPNAQPATPAPDVSAAVDPTQNIPTAAPAGGPTTPVTPTSTDPIQQGNLNTASLLNKEGQDVSTYLTGQDAANKNLQSAYQAQAGIANRPTADDVFYANKAKDDTYLQSLVDSKIDPNRYLHNMSTGSKIASAIGIALSGLGAGRGGQNLALNGLNDAINQDIEAQKNDRSNKMNVYNLNHQSMKDEQQAHFATQNQLLTGVQAKVAQAGAQSQNADTHFRASQLVNQIEQQKIANRRQIGILSQGSQQGQGGPGTAPYSNTGAVLGAVIKDPDDLKAAGKEISDTAKATDLHDIWQKNFNDLNGRFASGIFSPSDRQSAIESIAGPMEHLFEGRFNRDQALAAAESIMPGHVSNHFPLGTDPEFSQSTVDLKRQRGEDLFNSLKPPPLVLGRYNLRTDQFKETSSNPVDRFSPLQQKIYSIAKAHPNDPNSALALKKLGLE